MDDYLQNSERAENSMSQLKKNGSRKTSQLCNYLKLKAEILGEYIPILEKNKRSFCDNSLIDKTSKQIDCI